MLTSAQLISFRRDRKLVGKLPAGTVAECSKARLIRKLAPYDQWVEYTKPLQAPSWMDEATFQSLPDQLIVRELRSATKQKGGRTPDHDAGDHAVGSGGVSCG